MGLPSRVTVTPEATAVVGGGSVVGATAVDATSLVRTRALVGVAVVGATDVEVAFAAAGVVVCRVVEGVEDDGAFGTGAGTDPITASTLGTSPVTTTSPTTIPVTAAANPASVSRIASPERLATLRARIKYFANASAHP
jgi:hypothetical protein